MMFIMHRNEPVLSFDLDEGRFEILNESFLPISLRGAIMHTKNEMADYRRNYNAVISFLASRVISLDRTNAKKILNALRLSQSQTPEDKAKIAIICRALSITDSYWIKQENSDLTWNQLNLRHVSLNKVITQVSLCGRSLTVQGIPCTPELNGNGSYAHSWIREGDTLFLYKKSSNGGCESQIEVEVSKILDCFNVDHVKYFPASYLDMTDMCKCENLANDKLALVSANDVYSYCCRYDYNFYNFVTGLDADGFFKMCIVDYLIANDDRHMLNWGFYMDEDTGSLVKCHPLFDHNNAFMADTLDCIDGGQSLLFDNCSKLDVAKRAMKKVQFDQIFDLDPHIFLKKQHKDCFIERAEKLGLSIKLSKPAKRGLLKSLNLFGGN